MTDRGNVPIVLLPGEDRSIEWVGAELFVKASADDINGPTHQAPTDARRLRRGERDRSAFPAAGRL
jgi:hypothetical protein